VESDFYVSRIQPKRVVLCCHCAGTILDSPFELHTHLKAPEGPYSIVLPICKACLDSGCHIIVRNARQKANAKHARLIGCRPCKKVLRQEMATGKDASNDLVTSVAVADDEEVQPIEEAEEEHTTSPRRSRRNTRNASPRYVKLGLLYVLQVAFAYELWHLLIFCVQKIS